VLNLVLCFVVYIIIIIIKAICNAQDPLKKATNANIVALCSIVSVLSCETDVGCVVAL